jgi:hypothetical protein
MGCRFMGRRENRKQIKIQKIAKMWINIRNLEKGIIISFQTKKKKKKSKFSLSPSLSLFTFAPLSLSPFTLFYK